MLSRGTVPFELFAPALLLMLIINYGMNASEKETVAYGSVCVSHISVPSYFNLIFIDGIRYE